MDGAAGEWRAALACSGGPPPIAVHPRVALTLTAGGRPSPGKPPAAACRGAAAAAVAAGCVLTFCGGGAAAGDAAAWTVAIDGASISGVAAPRLRGVVCAAPGARVLLRGGRVERNAAMGGALRAAGPGALLGLEGVAVEGNRAAAGVERAELGAGDEDVTAGCGAGLFVADGAAAVVRGGRLRGNAAARDGGGAYVTGRGSRLAFERTLLESNRAAPGGAGGAAAAFAGAALTLDDVMAHGNRAGYGGALFAASASVSSTGGALSGNAAASDGGGAYVKGGSRLALNGTRVAGNSAGANNGGGLAADASAVDLSATSFSSNRAAQQGGGVAATNGSSVRVSRGSGFVGNEARYKGGALAAQDSEITVGPGPTRWAGNAALGGFGGAIFAYGASRVDIAGAAFVNNTAKSGGGLFADGGAKVALRGGRFENNRGGDQCGGAQLASGCRGEIVGTAFDGNEAPTGMGGALCIGKNVTLDVVGSAFRGNMAHQGGAAVVDGDDASWLRLAGCNFTGNAATASGGAVYVCNVGNVALSGCTLAGNSAARGGGIAAEEAVGMAGQLRLNVTNNTYIIGNTAEVSGGGLDLSCGVTRVRASTVAGNRAQLGGGAAFACGPGGRSGLWVDRASNFSFNRAMYNGGGIWLPAASNFDFAAATDAAMQNSAHTGAQISMPPKLLMLLLGPGPERQASDTSARGSGLDSTGAAAGLGSTAAANGIDSSAGGGGGGAAALAAAGRLPAAALATANFTVVSSYEAYRRDGAVPPFRVAAWSQDGSPMAGVRIVALARAPITSGASAAPAPSLTGDEAVTGPDGRAAFDRLQVRAPRGDYVIELAAGDFDGITADQPLYVTVRGCGPGEVIPESLPDTCMLCPAGMFSLLQHPAPGDGCRGCPDGAICFNGSLVVPADGHWRSARASEQVHPCPNRAACSRGRSVQALMSNRTALMLAVDGPKALCARGYEGPLCGSCAPGFGTSSALHCRACQAKPVIGAVTAVSAAALLAFMHVSVRLALSRDASKAAAEAQAVGAATVIKVLVRQLQQLQLISEVPLDWPPQLYAAIEWVSWLLKPGSTTAALECVLTGLDGASLAVCRVLMWLALPFIAFGLLMALQAAHEAVVHLWRYRLPIRARALSAHLRRAWAVTGMASLFFFYPNMVAAAFSTFACVHVDSASARGPDGLALAHGPPSTIGAFWMVDMHTRCWAPGGGVQMPFALTVGLAATLLLCVALPAAIILAVRRGGAGSPEPPAHYSTLASEYKERYAWWEAVNLILMALLVAAGTFGKAMGGFLNLAALVAVMLLSLLAQALARPQRARALGWLQMGALCAVLWLAYAGLTYFKVVDARPADDAYRTATAIIAVTANAAAAAALLAAAARAWGAGRLARAVGRSFASGGSLEGLGQRLSGLAGLSAAGRGGGSKGVGERGGGKGGKAAGGRSANGPPEERAPPGENGAPAAGSPGPLPGHGAPGPPREVGPQPQERDTSPREGPAGAGPDQWGPPRPEWGRPRWDG